MKNTLLEQSLQRIGEDLEEELFFRQENHQPHNTREMGEYMLEQFFTLPVEELGGIMPNTNARDIYYNGPNGYVPGRLADDPLRSYKNLLISSLVTLSNELQRRFPTDYELITTVGDACIREVERAENEEALHGALEAGLMIMKKRVLGNGRSSAYHPLVKQAKDYIYQSLHQKIDLGALAETLGTSQSYLSQLFRKYEGVTPQQFILNERLDRAKHLLVYTDRTVEDICHSLGFSTTSYFGKCLKAQTGMTPLQYRENFSEQYRKKTRQGS